MLPGAGRGQPRQLHPKRIPYHWYHGTNANVDGLVPLIMTNSHEAALERFQDDAALAECDVRVHSTGRAGAPDAIIHSVHTFSHGTDDVRITSRHMAREGVHTGGHVWNGSRQLARWLYTRRRLLPGLRVLELGCGLALPSVVAAKCGAAQVHATDSLPALTEHVEVNARANGCGNGIEAYVLDFTCRHEVEHTAASQGPWDLILFADCVYGGCCGGELPHALATLLSACPGSLAVGTFPSTYRTGVDMFFVQCSRAGLRVKEQPCTDESGGRLYLFSADVGTKPATVWGTVTEELSAVFPLFDDIEADC